MPKSHENLSETHIVGRSTTELIVRAANCPALASHQIAHVGVADAAPPYSMVRTHLNGTYMLACISGAGKILLDGRWQTCRGSWACLAPPHVLHAFHAIPGQRWSFCWVKYEQPARQQPIMTARSPVMAKFEGRALHSAILGLFYESKRVDSDPAMLRHWADLVQNYVLRFAQPWRGDNRLWSIWEEVEKNLGAPWQLKGLARSVHLSDEHLRRLCRREVGRSPMHHITYLRMQKAADLLENSPEKIQTIAALVGYENPFVFSNTFKKWIGWRPSAYRKKKRGDVEGVSP